MGGSGKLWLFSDLGCPECGRLVVGVNYRRGDEPLDAMQARMEQAMKSMDWHRGHAPSPELVRS